MATAKASGERVRRATAAATGAAAALEGVPCLWVVLEYAPLSLLLTLAEAVEGIAPSAAAAAAAAAAAPAGKEVQSTLDNDRFWRAVAHNHIRSFSFFEAARDAGMLERGLAGAAADALITERSWRAFAAERLGSVMRQYELLRRLYDEYTIAAGASRTKAGVAGKVARTSGTAACAAEHEQSLALSAVFTHFPKSTGLVSSANAPAAFGTPVVLLTPTQFAQLGQLPGDVEERELVAQVQCSLLAGNLACPAGAHVPEEGRMIFGFARMSMDDAGGFVCHVAQPAADHGSITPHRFARSNRFLKAADNVVTRLTCESGAVPWEVVCQFQDALKDLEKKERGENGAADDDSEEEAAEEGETCVEAWMGGRATSQQGVNAVEPGQFLLLQMVVTGDFETFMDGLELYFIANKDNLLRRRPRVLTSDGGNFSIYANC